VAQLIIRSRIQAILILRECLGRRTCVTQCPTAQLVRILSISTNQTQKGLQGYLNIVATPKLYRRGGGQIAITETGIPIGRVQTVEALDTLPLLSVRVIVL